MSKTSTQETKFKSKQDFNGRDNTQYINTKKRSTTQIIRIKELNPATETYEYKEKEIDLKKMWEDNYSDIISQLESE